MRLFVAIWAVVFWAAPALAQGVSIGNVTQAEGDVGNTPFELTITADPLNTGPTLVNWTTVQRGNGLQHAKADIDYVDASGQVLVPVGGTFPITVQVIGESSTRQTSSST